MSAIDFRDSIISKPGQLSRLSEITTSIMTSLNTIVSAIGDYDINNDVIEYHRERSMAYSRYDEIFPPIEF